MTARGPGRGGRSGHASRDHLDASTAGGGGDDGDEARGGSVATTGEGEASGVSVATTGGGDDGEAAAALPRKKRKRAKGCKTHDQRDVARRARGGNV